MKKFLALVSALLMIFLAVLPMTFASAESNGTLMYVSSSNGKGVRLRGAPSTSGKILDNMGEGMMVTVLSIVDTEWAYVKAECHGETGYVMRKFLSATDPTTLRQTFKTVTAHVVTVQPTQNNYHVNLRASASKSSTSLRRMTKGTQLTVIAESRAWFKVVDEFGTTGYVVKAYTTR